MNQLQAALAAAQSANVELTTAVDRLTAERDTARAKLPSARRQRDLDNAARIAADLKKARKQLRELRTARDAAARAHHEEVAALHGALKNAERDREDADNARHRIEERLGGMPGRAHYLLNLLQKKIVQLERDASTLPRNQTRSRAERHIEQLRNLADDIDRLLLAEAPAVSSGVGTRPGEPTVVGNERADSPGPAAAIDLSNPSSACAEPSAAAPATGCGTRDGTVHVRNRSAAACIGGDRRLRVQVLGGGSEIGGSAVLIEGGGTRLLVDAGLRPNAHSPQQAAPPLIATALDSRLDAVVITHGHNDHAGYVPKLLDDRREAKTICTPATAALLPTMWSDARRVMQQQADDVALYDWRTPLYGEAEVEVAEKSIQPLPYGRGHNIGALTVQLFDAGHILGAAGVVVSAGDQRVLITGDICDIPQLSVGPAQLPPRLARGADLLVIESTYCHDRHGDRLTQIRELVNAVENVVGEGGRVLIPAFGLGRAQEVALILREHSPHVPVLVDGLARNISDIYEREGSPDIFGANVQRVEDRQRWRLMRSFHSGVVITTSGMLSGGYAVPWAQQILPDPHSALVLCGYQDEESPGRALQQLVESRDLDGAATLTLHADGGPTAVRVAARVETYNLSAHADRDGLAAIIDELVPSETMLVHGFLREQLTFRQTLERGHGRPTVRNDVPWNGRS